MAKPKSKSAPTVAATPSVDLAFLTAVVNATVANSFVFSQPPVHAAAVAAGLVEVNPAMSDPTHGIATRATAAGVDYLKAHTAAQSAPAVAAVTTTPAPAASPQAAFTFEAGIPIPAMKFGGRKGGSTVYPFEAMPIGASFFVPNSEKRPNASKALASTVSAQNQKYSEEIAGQFVPDGKGGTKLATKQTRHYLVRSVEENGVKGARVWRDL